MQKMAGEDGPSGAVVENGVPGSSLARDASGTIEASQGIGGCPQPAVLAPRARLKTEDNRDHTTT